MNEINMSNYNTSYPSFSSSSSSKKCVPSVDARRSSSSSTCIFPKPPWLISTLHDLEGKMKSLSLIRNNGKDKDHDKDEINNVLDDDDEEEAEDTFAERAEIYYLKRPQLLNLLHDLYNNYLSLSDRYCQTLTKLQNHPITNDCDSDAQSSLSHQSSSSSSSSISDVDTIVASLVMKMVENDIILQELNTSEKKWGESIRKTELQASLLEVLESERLVLLSENSRLCVRADETLLMKRTTTTTTNDQVDVDKDHRLYMLNRRIEDLQEQIRCLQGQLTSGDRLMVMINHHQYHHQSPYYANKGLGWKLENEKMSNIVGCFNDYEGIASTSCSSSSNMGMINGERKKKTRKMMTMKKRRELKVGSWWNRFKNFELLLCGIHDDSTSR